MEKDGGLVDQMKSDLPLFHSNSIIYSFQTFAKFRKTSSLLVNIQGGPKVGIQFLNYFLYAFKLLAVYFMLLVK